MTGKFFRDALLTTTIMVGAALIVSPAYAQDADARGQSDAEEIQTGAIEAVAPTDAVTGEEIVVTGTLIRNPNLVSSSPVTVIGESEIQLQQANVAEEFLRELPGAVASIGAQTNNGNGGSSFANLRNLGENRNLVLLDGGRLVPAGLDGIVDLNNIPLALIERVDILTGGASTTYGADAVAGVINFITKDDFSGAQIDASQQITEQGDGNIFRVDLTLGANFDDGRGNAVLSLGYQQADPVFQGDRDVSAFSIDSQSGNPGGSGTTVPVRLSGVRGNGRTSAQGNGGTQQLDPATGFAVPTFQTFNFNPQNIFQTPFERFNIFGAARYEVADDIEVYGRGLFSKNTVSTRIASSGTFGNTLNVGLGNPFLPAGLRNQFCGFDTVAPVDIDPNTAGVQEDPAVAGIQRRFTQAECDAAATTTDPTNPNFRSVDSAIFRRFVEAGTRNSDYTTTLFDFKAGVRGDLTENLSFDIFGAYGESENIQRQTGQGLRSRLIQATDVVIGANGAPACRNATGGCAPLNLFGPAGTISQDAINFLNVSTSASTLTRLSQIRGFVSGDFGFSVTPAAEPVSFAVGGEYRDYLAASSSDVSNQTPGEVLGNGAASPDVTGTYDVKEAFAELIAPIYASDDGFLRGATLELGGRVSDYSTSGTSYTYKGGASVEFGGGFKIRGNYQRAARSPNIDELFSPLVTGLDNLAADPCQGQAPNNNANLRAICLAQGAPLTSIGSIQAPSAAQVNVTGGGNLNLDVEKADTYVVGFVFQPEFIRGLAITADYYNIKVKDAISTPEIDDIITACFGANPASPPANSGSLACTGIRRNPTTGGLDGSSDTTPGLPQAFSNSGRIETDGIDLTATYRRDLGFAGLNLSFNGNWTNRSRFQATPTSVNRECVGFYSVNCQSILPEFTFNQRTTLSFGPADVSLFYRYLDDVQIEPLAQAALIADPESGGPFRPEFSRIKAKHYFDLALRVEATEEFEFVAVVENLFDKKPPLVGNSIGSTAYNSGNTFPATYDPLGRSFSFGARLKF